MVPNSKECLKRLDGFIYCNVVAKKSVYSVTAVKQDGTVTVRFRSDKFFSAMELAECCARQLTKAGMDFVQTDDNKLQVPVAQFAVKEDAESR